MEGNNSTSNATGQSSSGHELELYFVAISILILTENILGLVVIRLNPVLHTTANKFVCSMAVVDIVTGLLTILTTMFSEFRIRNYFPSTNLFPYFTVTTIVGYSFLSFSMVHMTIIGFERYVFIVHPFVYRRRVNDKTIAIVLAMFWLFFASYTALMFGANTMAELQSSFINASKSKYKFYSYHIGIFIYFICSILTVVAYSLIVKVAVTRNRIKRERNRITQTDESSKNALKTITFFMVVYGLFAILTMPVFVLIIVRIVYGHGYDNLITLAVLLLKFVPGINFFVLTVLNADFRSALKKTLAGLCRRHR